MKYCAKNLFLVLACTSLLAAPAAVQAQSGDGYNYTINASNTNTITITGYTGPGGAVTIPTNINNLLVTGIGEGALQYCTSMTSLTIPSNVTSIGLFAFANCTSLTAITVAAQNSRFSSLNGVLFFNSQTELVGYPGGLVGAYTIPSSVTQIYNDAFYECTGLTSVTIPTNVTSIGDGAFEGCSGLTNVTIPNSVATIGDSAFFGCTGLTTVTIPNSVFYIGIYAFGTTALTSVTIPSSVTTIGEIAFADCPSLTAITVVGQNSAYSSVNGVLFDKSLITLLEFPGGLGGSYTIPNSVTSIGDGAFYLNQSLTSVTIPNSVTNIGEGVFQQCGILSSVTIGNSVTNIEDNAFSYCPSLTSVYFQGNAPTVDPTAFVGGNLSGYDPTTVYYEPGTTGWASTFGGLPTMLSSPFTYTTQNSTITITGYTGSGGSASIPSAINGLPVTSIGNTAFEYNTSITNITIPNSVTTIGNDAFEGCSGLTSVIIPDSVTNIGNDAFGNCTSLTNVTIPDSVSSIGAYVFENCTSLTIITIPASVTNIGNYAFAYCTGLIPYFQGNAPGANSTVFADPPTAHYLPGTTGWATFSANTGLPVVVWTPQIQADGANFGVQNHQFGFNINWSSGQVIVVEACTNLAHPVWTPLLTNTLTNASFYFSEPVLTNESARFYRILSP